MKYLEKTFSVYPSVKPARPRFGVPVAKQIDPKHKYSDIGGMCRFCSLDKIGHQKKYEARS
jgi:hypothetical protein